MWRAASRWRFSCKTGKTPSGAEVRTLLKHLVRRIRRHWPRTRLTFRGWTATTAGPSHGMVRGERRRLHLRPGGQSRPAPSRIRCRRRSQGAPRRVSAPTGCAAFASFDYAAGSWRRKRRVVARLEATTRGFDARYIVTSLTGGPRHLYEGVYCARGQAENLIKLHKGQLASDRTSCQSPARSTSSASILHTAAYWLMLALRDAVPRLDDARHGPSSPPSGSACSRSADRVVEKAARIRIHFASACPDAALFRMLAGRTIGGLEDPDRRGNVPREPRSLQPRTPTPITSDPDAASASNGEPCSIKINRQTLPALNKSG